MGTVSPVTGEITNQFPPHAFTNVPSNQRVPSSNGEPKGLILRLSQSLKMCFCIKDLDSGPSHHVHQLRLRVEGLLLICGLARCDCMAAVVLALDEV